MSVKDFYNAVTPGSSLTHGVGRGAYTMLRKDDVCSETTYANENLPIDYKKGPGLLNEVKIVQLSVFSFIS
jgi:hypothetical protein